MNANNTAIDLSALTDDELRAYNIEQGYIPQEGGFKTTDYSALVRDDYATPNLDAFDQVLDTIREVRGITTGLGMSLTSTLIWMYCNTFIRILEEQDRIPEGMHNDFRSKAHDFYAERIRKLEEQNDETLFAISWIYGQIASSEICPTIEEFVWGQVKPRDQKGTKDEAWEATLKGLAQTLDVPVDALRSLAERPTKKATKAFAEAHELDSEQLTTQLELLGTPPQVRMNEHLKALAETFSLTGKEAQSLLQMADAQTEADARARQARLMEHMDEVVRRLEQAVMTQAPVSWDLPDRLARTLADRTVQYLAKIWDRMALRAAKEVARMGRMSPFAARMAGSQRFSQTAANATLVRQAVEQANEVFNRLDEALEASREAQDDHDDHDGHGTKPGMH